MKTLTKDVVKTTVLDLIKKNGETTTLDIKKVLRAEGYWATQKDVSRMVDDIYAYMNLTFDDSRGYRVYSEFDNYVGSATSVSVTSTIKTKVATKASYKDAVEVASPSNGDWEVRDKSTHIIRYFEADIPEYAVRYAFYKLTDVRFADTRAKRFK